MFSTVLYERNVSTAVIASNPKSFRSLQFCKVITANDYLLYLKETKTTLDQVPSNVSVSLVPGGSLSCH